MGLIITPDSSVNDTKECKILSELGFKILIGGEHHIIERPNPYATIVSNELGNLDNKEGSGGLVTWHMCNYINKDLAKDLISYVAISLIGDSMDMTTEENYTFTKWGKERIHPYLQPFIELNRDGDTVACRSYSYGLITCLNSLIRLGTMEDKQELFMALCGEIDPTNIIDKCKKYHTQQSNDSKKMMEEVEILNNSSVVICKINEKTTMTGLIAGKLMSKYNKPILLAHEYNGQMSGSVRSPIELKELCEKSELFTYASGHSFAHGFSYPLSKQQDIIDYFDSVIVDCEPCIDTLASTTIKSIPNHLYSLTDDYKHLWSKGINSPTYHIKPFTIYNTDIQALGKGSTIKFNKDGLDFIMFFVSNETKENVLLMNKPKTKISIELIVELSINRYTSPKNNRTYINNQAIIKEIQCSPTTNTIDDIL